MKRLRISMLVIVEISGLALFAGCGDSSAPTLNGPSTLHEPISITLFFSNNCSGGPCLQIGGMGQFGARVSCAIGVTCPSLASSQGVTWSVAGTGCSGASCGTIDATGKYSAPATVPNPDTVTVTARLVADPTYAAPLTIAIVTVPGASFSFSPNPTSVEFGNQMVNTTSAPRAVTVTNTGTTPQPVFGRMNGTPGQWQNFASTNDCPTMLAAGASCTFNITFTPSATGGRGATLYVDGTFDEEGFVNLGGTGTN